MKRKAVGIILGALAMCVAYAPNAAAFATAPTYPENFCAALDSVVSIVNGTPLLLSLLDAEDLALINSLACNTADLNGDPIDTDVPPDGSPDAPGPNGMLDGRFELGVIAQVLNNAGPLQAQARAAYATNYGLLATALNNPGCSYCTLLPVLAPGLGEALIRVLAGFATEGDATTLQVINLLGGILTGIGVVLPAESAYSGLPALFGPEGDADSDGCTNRQEYNAYFASGAATYVANALNAAVNPGNCGGGEGEGEGEGETGVVSIVGPRQVEIGDSVELRIVGATGDYSWTKNGGVLPGEDGSSLVFDPVAEGDAGTYVGTVDTGAKAVYVSAPFTLQVFPQGSLPVAGGLGLAAVAGACALAGSTILRRRK